MQTCDLLIKDGTVLIKSDVLSEHVDIAVQDGRIVETGTDLWKKYQAAETISGKGKLFMPAHRQPYAYGPAAVKGSGTRCKAHYLDQGHASL